MGFYLSEMEPQDGSEQGRDGARHRCLQAPSGSVGHGLWTWDRRRGTREKEGVLAQWETRVDGSTWGWQKGRKWAGSRPAMKVAMAGLAED